jgi:hypothetical protein
MVIKGMSRSHQPMTIQQFFVVVNQSGLKLDTSMYRLGYNLPCLLCSGLLRKLFETALPDQVV